MDTYKSTLRLAIKNNLTIEQLYFLYLVRMKDFMDKDSWSNQYVDKIQKFSLERVLDPLIEKDLLFNLNKAGEYWPEFLMPTKKGEELFATEMMGEEFWDNYPKSLPIGQGGRFIARAGIEKGDLIDLYLKKIDYNPSKHAEVMGKLKIYESMVIKGQINGHKIVNWVKEELWSAIPDKDEPLFGKEV